MTPETKINCPQCRGWGRISRSNGRVGSHLSTSCVRCKGTGKITWGELKDYEQVPGKLYLKSDVERAREGSAKAAFLTILAFSLLGSVSAQDSACHITPSPTPIANPLSRDSKFIVTPNIRELGLISPKDFTLYDADARLHCSHEPIVTREGSRWLITFKK